jgi:glycosyltransferase involved in cell wall biosynthesis
MSRNITSGAGAHILIIVQNLPVPLDRRVWSECRELVAAGYRVSVICPKGDDGASFETLDGVRIHRYRPPRPASGLATYAWEFAYCWLRTAALALRIFRRERFDVIQACNPPDTYFALARLFRPFGVRFVFDHHDLCPELYESRDPGRKAPRAVLAALRWLERATYRTAGHVITTNETYLERARQRTGKPRADFTVVRSSPDPLTMRPGEPVAELRNGRAHLCCYLGIMGHQDGVENVVRAARIIKHDLGRDDVQFALLGFGDTLPRLRELVCELDLEDVVTFTGQVQLPAISSYLSTAAVGLCPDPKTSFNDASTMNKVLEYMAHQIPVVSFDLVETQKSAGSAGRYVAWVGDPEADQRAYALAILELLDDPDRRAAMGREGRARIENGLGWPAQAARYVGAYDRLLGRESPAPEPPIAEPRTSLRSAPAEGFAA